MLYSHCSRQLQFSKAHQFWSRCGRATLQLSVLHYLIKSAAKVHVLASACSLLLLAMSHVVRVCIQKGFLRWTAHLVGLAFVMIPFCTLLYIRVCASLSVHHGFYVRI